MQTAAVTINWATILPLLIPVLYALIPPVVVWVGIGVKDFLDAHTSGKTQEVLEKIAATAVQAVEQMFAGQNSSPALQKQKFDTAASLLLRTASAQVGVQLSDDQIKALIESAVHALNAGAVALVPGAAPLLPADAAVSNNANLDQFKADVLSGVETLIPGVVQSTLTGLLGKAINQYITQSNPAAQQTVGQSSSPAQADVVLQPGAPSGLAGTAPGPQTTVTPQPPIQP